MLVGDGKEGTVPNFKDGWQFSGAREAMPPRTRAIQLFAGLQGRSGGQDAFQWSGGEILPRHVHLISESSNANNPRWGQLKWGHAGRGCLINPHITNLDRLEMGLRKTHVEPET